jgi:transposase InsO family protein
MGLSLSTYYYQCIEKKSDDEIIAEEIKQYIELMPESGYRPTTIFLKKSMVINHKRVNRIMREFNLLCRKKRKFKTKTTDSRHGLKKYLNIAKDVETTNINQVIVGDVTAYDVKGNDHFLASLMDRHNRRVIGKAVSDKNNTELVLAALNDAMRTRGTLEGCIHHTDSDVRYCSADYINRLEFYRMNISMCVGNAYENAHAESFNGTIKRQEINISDYDTKDESAKSIFHFIDKYNTIRPHSSLRGLSPIEYENMLLQMKEKE